MTKADQILTMSIKNFILQERSSYISLLHTSANVKYIKLYIYLFKLKQIMPPNFQSNGLITKESFLVSRFLPSCSTTHEYFQMYWFLILVYYTLSVDKISIKMGWQYWIYSFCLLKLPKNCRIKFKSWLPVSKMETHLSYAFRSQQLFSASKYPQDMAIWGDITGRFKEARPATRKSAMVPTHVQGACWIGWLRWGRVLWETERDIDCVEMPLSTVFSSTSDGRWLDPTEILRKTATFSKISNSCSTFIGANENSSGWFLKCQRIVAHPKPNE